MIKYGLKLWTRDTKLINEAKKLIDAGMFHYIELIIDPDFLDASPFDYDLPYVIHSPHENFGVDIGDETKKRYTLEMIRHSLKFADKLKARQVILHAGTRSKETAKVTLSEIGDGRILLENMPKVGLNGEKCLGYDAYSMCSLNKDDFFGVCLDFGHAVRAAISLKQDYKKIISEFMGLKPKMFHISDGDLSSEIDNHLTLGEGQFDLKYFKKCIEKSKSKSVTLETPRRNTNSLRDDLNNIKLLKLL